MVSIGGCVSRLELIKDVYCNRIDNCYINSNCLEILPNLPASSIDLVITQPPSWDQFSYTSDNGAIGYGQLYDEYMNSLYIVVEELGRILKKHGNIFLAFSDFRKHGRLISIADDLCNYIRTTKKVDLVERLILYIPNKAQVNNPKYFANKFVWILHLTKDTYFFKKPHSVFNVLTHEIDESSLIPDPLPYNFIDIILSYYGDKGFLALDPFCGSGSVMRLSKNFGMRSIGIDVSKTYYERYNSFVIGEYAKI